ncbi:hypothetical protein SmJEL517_g00250 [Synchytrium microbalum]|uniref:Uncharacterized protein n=1 Tax=Synchytrium microbalum TaxID=1806994 RepID=A0A507CEC4_9FUNG|nr:uncharacterized protein SmJEL517_g00250 [Synchytrium microbalum]TPX37972.1 hypothetical protein SmJEL517_g00250 [Synchytrium microbalum]
MASTSKPVKILSRIPPRTITLDHLPHATVAKPPAKISSQTAITPSSIPNVDTISLHKISPRGQYRESMRALRRQWLQDIKEDDKAALFKAHQAKEAEFAKKKKLEDSMRKYIADQQSDFSSFVHSSPSSSSSSFSNDEFDVVSGSSDSPSNSIDGTRRQEDPILAAKRQAWHDALRTRRQRRLTTYLNKVSDETENRLSDILYLYHTASDFVTYANLDAKIAAAMDVVRGTTEIKVDFQPDDSIDAALSRHSSNTPSEQRERALGLIMEGRVASKTYIDRTFEPASPAIGPPLVREWKQQYEAKGGDAAARQREDETRNRHSRIEATHNSIQDAARKARLEEKARKSMDSIVNRALETTSKTTAERVAKDDIESKEK